ncbi:Ankyrin-2 [Xylographa trunciseda]|nr:Ankyrin-2 [Xylographa trunciseda]
MWISHAARPMKVEELAVAMVIEAGPVTFAAIEDLIPLDLLTDLQQVIGSLIKIENEQVTIANQYIKDFVVAKRSAAWEIDGHLVITIMCITYLSMEEVHGIELMSADLGSSWQLDQFSKFLTYAVQYWPYHYRRATDKTLCLDHIMRFLSNDRLARRWSQFERQLHYPIVRQSSSLTSPLHFAAQLGLADLVKLLLDRNSEIIDELDRALVLDLAVQNGHHDVARMVLENGITDVITIETALHNEDTEKANLPLTLIYKAARNGHVSVVKRLIDAGSSVNLAQPSESSYKARTMTEPCIAYLDGCSRMLEHRTMSPLAFAAVCGHHLVVQVLLNHDAKVNEAFCVHETPLLLAVANGHLSTQESHSLHLAMDEGLVEIVALLLSKGANPQVTNNKGSTPLHLASRRGDLEIVELLLAYGAAINTVDKDLHTALYYAAKHGSEAITCLLLSKNASPNLEEDLEPSSLTQAATNELTLAVESMLAKGANTEVKNQEGDTAILCATKAGYREIVRLLLSNGANPQIQNKDQQSPLPLAASAGFEEITGLLLNSDADLSAIDSEHRNALDLAVDEKREAVVALLLDRGARVDKKDRRQRTLLHRAANIGSLDIARRLISKSASLDAKDYLKWTPLHYAAYRGSEKIVRLLLELRGDPIAEDDDGWTALHLAARSGQVKVMEELHSSYKDLNLRTKNGRTPLHFACQEISAARWLVNQGADVDATDNDSCTVLMAATAASIISIIDLLLDCNAEVNSSSIFHGTALHIAACNGSVDIVLRLLAHGADVTTTGGKYHSVLQAAAAQRGVTVVDKQGRSILHHATSGGECLFGWLLNFEDKPELVSSEDDDGWTPLHWVFKGGDRDNIDRLRVAGADYRKECRRGWNPRQIGIFHGHEDLSILFNNKGNSDNDFMKKVMEEMFWRVKEGIYHEGVSCDGCLFDIYGIRFKCQECFDFCFCFKCYWTHDKTHPNQTFLRTESGPEAEPHVEEFNFYRWLPELEPEDYEIEGIDYEVYDEQLDYDDEIAD